MSDLISIYSMLARRWQSPELTDRFAAAAHRGSHDLCTADPARGAIANLAASIPRATSLAIATHTLHLLPTSRDSLRTDLADGLVQTIDVTSSGALRRCQLALDQQPPLDPDDCLTIANDVAAELLERASPDIEPRSIATHAQEAVRWIAIAIDAHDRDDHTAFCEALSDCLGRLLVVCIFADAAQGRLLPVSAARSRSS